LVANRGEIAVRVLHTAAALGIPTVAVYPSDDAGAGHAERADQAVQLPGTGPAAYLDIDALLRVARDTGADAVHPGYGFLAERADFARRCAEAGLTFVGPSPAALALFSDKAATRARATELGIRVPAGTTGGVDLAGARAFFESLGPGAAVMVKAVAGGGGRGMRPVHDPERLAEAFARCASEAEHAFGDGSLYVEQLLPGARHVEVQLIGDRGGTVLALGDRDCSVQRRRQKLVEIGPAPALAEEVRLGLHRAAVALGASVDRLGLATVEFLVGADTSVLLECNARLQVEHTVTEQVTGLDLVELQLRLADGATLAELGLDGGTRAPRGVAVQCRVNAETVTPDGEVRPSGGTLSRFRPPTGRGVRVDTAAGPGYPINPRYDSLLAKVVVSAADLDRAVVLAGRALAEFELDVPSNLGLLRAILAHPDLGRADTGFLDAHLAELVDATDQSRAPLPGDIVTAPRAGLVVELPARPGDSVRAGDALAVLEAMKMEHVVPAPEPLAVVEVLVKTGDAVAEGTPLLVVEPADSDHTATDGADTAPDPDRIRPDLAEAIERHRIGLDQARPEAVARRHDAGRLTARESLHRLCDPGTLVEYGALAIAAQRRRRELADLIERTPADGMVTGTAEVHGRRTAVLAYDYTVLAGTQGVQNHRKTDRLLALALRQKLPVVIFAEGGGGRPGDTDQPGFTGLDVPTFRTCAELVGRVPTVAVVGGYCFAGNAALAGVCDVLIATEDASIGMGGPAMISGGGLGEVAPGDVGPMSMQWPNGVVDMLVPDDAAAADAARSYLSYFAGPVADHRCADQRELRRLIPENRVRSYPVRPVLHTLFDTDSVLELRAGFGDGMITALARLAGHPVGVIANNPMHLGGAIDGDAADKATRFLGICEAHRLPVISLCDTPGFMVGPDAERTATVRRFGAMFVAGAQLTVPKCLVVLRKGYGLGAMAMAGGDLRATALAVSWPTGEFGGMGLEGSVRLGYRKELDALPDPAARHARYQELVARAYDHGKALSVATTFEIDDVIDPADTRACALAALGLVKT
jgi:acetyl/propionyl-CoA carboxylase alpha subunit/acetyl-CoA carboxylase carboxyltransferase component